MITNTKGESSSRSVDGVGSATYDVKGWIVAATFQNNNDEGYLSVTILKDGKKVKTESTNAAYGVVSISTQ